MDKVAFILDGNYVFWRSIILVVAVFSAILMAISLRIWQKKSLMPILVASALAIVLSVYIGRVVHWYCRFEGYDGLAGALTELHGGGYSLMGAVIGTVLAFLIVRVLQLTKDLPSLLDCAAPGAALGIFVGRLGERFSASNRGKMLISSESFFASPVLNSTSGQVEWRFATYLAQSLWALVIFAILLIIFLRKKDEGKKTGNGDVFCMFMCLYGLGQIILDSTRYDALFLRSNGFVSLEQIFSLVIILAVLAVYSVRSVKANSLRGWHFAIWLMSIASLGGVGYMEYYVQRHGDQYIFAYSIMASCLLLYLAMTLWAWRSSKKKRYKH